MAIELFHVVEFGAETANQAVRAAQPAPTPANSSGLFWEERINREYLRSEPNIGRLRVHAVHLIERMGTDAASMARALVTKLNDAEPEMRLAVKDALLAIGPVPAAAVSDWVARLRDPALHLRMIRILGACGQAAHNALPAIRPDLLNPDRTVREAALSAVTKIAPSDPEFGPAVVAALTIGQINLRFSFFPRCIVNLSLY